MRFLWIGLLLMSCTGQPNSVLPWREIAGRSGVATYRARVPEGWEQKNSPITADTTLPICEFVIGGEIRLVVHNFPAMPSIPPGAQIARWKRQFDGLDPGDVHIRGEAWGGFSGLAFTAAGLKKGKRVGVLAWAMQLAPEHSRVLAVRQGTEDARADYTIKAVGPEQILLKHKSEIVHFAHSFELIHEIPSPL